MGKMLRRDERQAEIFGAFALSIGIPLLVLLLAVWVRSVWGQ